jgi:hypothetical protein
MSRPITLFAIFLAALAAGCAAGPVVGWAAAAVAGLVAGALALAVPALSSRTVEPPPPIEAPALAPVAVVPVAAAPAAPSPPVPADVVASPPAPPRRTARVRPRRPPVPAVAPAPGLAGEASRPATLGGPGRIGAPVAPSPDRILSDPELARCMVTRAGTMRCPEGVRVQRKAGSAVMR